MEKGKRNFKYLVIALVLMVSLFSFNNVAQAKTTQEPDVENPDNVIVKTTTRFIGPNAVKADEHIVYLKLRTKVKGIAGYQDSEEITVTNLNSTVKKVDKGENHYVELTYSESLPKYNDDGKELEYSFYQTTGPGSRTRYESGVFYT